MLIRNGIILLLLLFLTSRASSQETIPDSIMSKLSQADDKTKTQLYNHIARNNTLNSPEKRIEYAQKALSLADKLNLREEQYHAYMNLATGYYLLGKNIDALEADLNALEVATAIDNNSFIAKSHNALGVDYLYLGNYEKSLEHFLTSVEIKKNIIKETGDQKTEQGLAVSYNNIGAIYLDLRHFIKAGEYYIRALEINEKYGDSSSLSRNLHNLGVLYEKQNDFSKALSFFNRSLNIRKSSGDKREIAETMNNIGIVFKKLKLYDKALHQFKESIRLFREINYATGIAYASQSMANILLETGKTEESYHYIIQAIELATKHGLKKQASESYESLAQYFYKVKRYDEAYLTLLIYLETKDSLFSESMTEKLTGIELKAETESREREILLQKAELQKKDAVLKQKTFQRNAIAGGLILAIALVSVIFLAYKRVQKSNAQLAAQKEQIEKQNRELRVLNATKDKFFNIIAHDLKGPFSTIMGLSDLLSENFRTLDDEGKLEFVRNISSSSHETYKLLENLLEWSRSQSGYMKFEPENILLKPYIEELLPLFQPRLTAKKITIELEIDAPLNVTADRNMINTILRNLVSNAIKFSFPEGVIHLSARKMNGMTEISVTDHGTGLSEKDIGRLFRIDEHFRLDGTQNEKGTGLGLILCKELVEKHNGTISAESTEGKGSKFTFTLPSS